MQAIHYNLEISGFVFYCKQKINTVKINTKLLLNLFLIPKKCNTFNLLLLISLTLHMLCLNKISVSPLIRAALKEGFGREKLDGLKSGVIFLLLDLYGWHWKSII